jgi:hypothetical protein
MLKKTLRLAASTPGRIAGLRFVPMRKIFIFALFAALAVAANTKTGNTRGPIPPYRVAVIDGEGALNSLPNRGAHDTVVKVSDGTGRPIVGASVDFDTPKGGPGANFNGGSTHIAVTTNAEGIAKTPGLRNNGVQGAFSILVHVAYHGQTIGELMVHQTNVQRKAANLVSSVRGGHQEPPATSPDASTTTGVLGIAMGDQFMINGTATPGNANVAPGNRIQTQNSPVTIYIHDHCEFLVGPHSSVIVQPHLLSVMNGAVRAKHFGDCKFGYGGLWVTSPATNGDGVVALSSEHMEIGSVSGPLQIANAIKVVGTVPPGTVSAFNFSDSAASSGASVASPTSTRVAFMLGAGTGVSLLGLGLAVTAIVQPTPISTSP